MPKSFYLQTIARRGKNDLPQLMPPRSPLSRMEVAQLPELSDEIMPTQPLNSVKEIFPQQQPSKTPRQEVPTLASRSLADAFNPAPLPVSSRVELPHEVETAPIPPEIRPINLNVQPSLQRSAPSSQTTASATQFLQLPNTTMQVLPSSTVADQTPAPSATNPRSYLQTAARTPTVEQDSVVSSVSSTDAIASNISTIKTNAPEGAEPVLLQPPQNYSISQSSKSETQNADLLPYSAQQVSRSPTTPTHSVHIGTIDIHITPPPTPPSKTVATAPKPVSSSSLSRGFTSSFGLRQG